MPANSLQDLYSTMLRMIYDAERQGLDFLPRLAQRARNEGLRTGLEAHRSHSEEHVRRLERLFQDRGQQPQPEDSLSTRALIQEADRMMRDVQDPDTLDALIIAAAQAIEHHEMADYGTARAWASQLGSQDEAGILQSTLGEEQDADRILSEIAERMVNPEAARKQGRVAAERDVTPRAQAGDVMQRGGAADRGTTGGGSAEGARGGR